MWYSDLDDDREYYYFLRFVPNTNFSCTIHLITTTLNKFSAGAPQSWIQ